MPVKKAVTCELVLHIDGITTKYIVRLCSPLVIFSGLSPSRINNLDIERHQHPSDLMCLIDLLTMVRDIACELHAKGRVLTTEYK